ncbi:MAG: [Clostridia bacterium]|nr:[FeFe] hydrogenase H-cluster maturation GTPase HydF [Clostridia bacterium]
VVSDIPGTTTDPVSKAMELLPLGPVVIIDTPGLDDEGTLGELRIQKTRQVLAKTDIAVLVIDAQKGISKQDQELLNLFEERKLPHLLVFNKADLISSRSEKGIYVSAQTREGIDILKERLGALAPNKQNKCIVMDKLPDGATVVLVIPIDEAAPKGRIILPQQLTLRELLDHHCTVVSCQDTELKETLNRLKLSPDLIITDSQAFGRVAKATPCGVPLTSFSILFARYKGDLATLVKGAALLSSLKDNDPVLICEGCTHHRQCNDIGTVKLPAWIEAHCGAKPKFSFTSGGTFPEDLTPYRLVVHCGGCMLNEAEMQHRIQTAREAGVPIVNYGIAIAQMNGILKRSLEIFPEIEELLPCKN